MYRSWWIVACMAAIVFCNACGGNSSETVYNVTVNVTPLTSEVAASASQQFTATTYGAADTAVIWYVNGVEGGNSTYGTVTQNGRYTAPSVVPSPSTVTVTAISHANENDMASASVNIVSGIKVAVSPATVNLNFGQTQQFTASINGSTSTDVTWQVGSITGGNSTLGTISSSGLYTAPSTASSTPMAVSVTALSKTDTTKLGTASVTFHGGIGITVSPASPSVATYGAQQFTAAVTGSTNTGVTWKVNNVVGGNAIVGAIDATGLYRAPRSVPTVAVNGASKTTTVKVTAVSQADSTVSSSVVLTIYAVHSLQQTSPSPLGVSGGNASDSGTTSTCCGGTLGALVSRGGEQFVLSASHVLAPNASSAANDSIVQPGLLDASCSTSQVYSVANLAQWVQLRNSSGPVVDAAMARVISGRVDLSGKILQLGDTLSNGIPTDGAPHAGIGVAPTVGMAIAKSGRSTGITCSTISVIDLTASNSEATCTISRLSSTTTARTGEGLACDERKRAGVAL